MVRPVATLIPHHRNGTDSGWTLRPAPGRCLPATIICLLVLLFTLTARAAEPDIQIEVTGLSDEMHDAVIKNLSIYTQKDHPLLNDALIRRLHKQADQEIKLALQPFGYYRPSITAKLGHDNGHWLAQYHIDPGPPVRLADVDVSLTGPGRTDPILKTWLKDYPLKVNDIPVHKVYEDAKQELLQLARDRGYFDGTLVKHQIHVDLDTYQASLSLHYDTGPRYFFGTIRFDQNEFSETFLRRYLTFHPGDAYDAGKLLALRRALSDSDYFDRIDITPHIEQAEDRAVPITIKLAARKKHRYLAGIGYSTDTGPRGMLGFENRRGNSFGHKYDVTLRESDIRTRADAHYTVPMKRPNLDYIIYSAGWIDEHTSTVQRTTSSVAIDFTRQIKHWQRTIGLSYELERYRLGNRDNSTLLIPHAQWQRIKADRRIHTGHGWLLNLDTRGASDAVLSSSSFLQGRLESKYIYTFSNDNRVLLRGTAGSSWTPELVDLPASQRFLTGGDQSIRGYAYNSLGPTDSEGTVIGGSNLLVGSVEYEFNVTGRANLAVFMDAGNAYNNNDKFHAMRGAGFGLRWQFPIGDVGIDLACALDRPGDPWRLHITLGPDL